MKGARQTRRQFVRLAGVTSLITIGVVPTQAQMEPPASCSIGKDVLAKFCADELASALREPKNPLLVQQLQAALSDTVNGLKNAVQLYQQNKCQESDAQVAKLVSLEGPLFLKARDLIRNKTEPVKTFQAMRALATECGEEIVVPAAVRAVCVSSGIKQLLQMQV